MKTKMDREDLLAWLMLKGCKISDERLASAISTNIYLDNKGVIAIFDNGTISLQGKPPKEFIEDFKALCSQKATPSKYSINFSPEPEIDIFDALENSEFTEEDLDAFMSFLTHPPTAVRVNLRPLAGKIEDNEPGEDGW